jgi:cytochrome c553
MSPTSQKGQKRKAASLLASLALALAASSACAQDAGAGRMMAAQRCAACHGLLGASQLPDAPHLAAQPFPYLVKQLLEFRGGFRRDERMTVVAKDLSDADIANLAAFYANVPVEFQGAP